MNVIKKLLLVMLLFFCVGGVKAYEITVGASDNYAGKTYHPKKYYGDTLVYCTESLRGASHSCDLLYKEDPVFGSALDYIINKSDQGYGCKELTLSYFHYKYYAGLKESGIMSEKNFNDNVRGREDWLYECPSSLYTEAKSVFDNISALEAGTAKVFDKKTLSFAYNSSSGKYETNVNINKSIYSLDSCTIAGNSISPVSDMLNISLDPGIYGGNDVTLTCKFSYSYPGLSYFTDCKNKNGENTGQNLLYPDGTKTIIDHEFSISGRVPNPKLTIRYHSNGATTMKIEGKDITSIPSQTINKGVKHDNGLYDINVVDDSRLYLYLAKTNYKSMGKWLLNSVQLDYDKPILWDGAKACIAKEVTSTSCEGGTYIADLSDGSVTIDLYAGWSPNGKIKLKKVNTRGNSVLNKDITLGIYSDSSCSNLIKRVNVNTGGSGFFEIGGLDMSPNYYAKELSIDSDIYAVSNECINIGKTYNGHPYSTSVPPSNPTYVEFVNKTRCEVDFETDSSIKNRLHLYKKYNFRNLLNFEITDSLNACSSYTPNYNKSESCLSTKQISDESHTNFNDTNLSNYNDTYRGNGDSISYCLTDFELISEAKFKNKVKSGRMVLKGGLNNGFIIGTVSKTCYIHKDEYYNYNINYANYIYYDTYINNINVDNKSLNSHTSLKSNIAIQLEGEFYKVSQQETVTYTLNPIYVYKLSGKVCSENLSECMLLGYGVASNFNDGAKENYASSFNFSITGNQSIFDFNENNVCEYTVDPEIIQYEKKDVNKGVLELEFRTVDTLNPFNRETSSNWCSASTCDGSNSIVNAYIKDRNNSYNIKNEEPLYKIVLTPELINEIKGYNASVGYDDYNMTCKKNNKICVSNFLTDLKGLEIYSNSPNRLCIAGENETRCNE